ncbi:MAG: hypothetical protein NTV80_03920, partial [Verrucomicrobia bacterium]|nr:hypothetical protein [Verrucomicrobiota bacterium]
MPEDDQPEDYFHLPTADASADAAKQAKAELWKQIAEKRRSKISATSVPEPQANTPTEPETHPVLQDDWAELLDLDPDSPSAALPPMQMPEVKPLISTPVEIGTRSDLSSKKRSVIRRNAPPASEPESGVVTQVFIPTKIVPTVTSVPVESSSKEPSIEPLREKANPEPESQLTPGDENQPAA